MPLINLFEDLKHNRRKSINLALGLIAAIIIISVIVLFTVIRSGNIQAKSLYLPLPEGWGALSKEAVPTPEDLIDNPSLAGFSVDFWYSSQGGRYIMIGAHIANSASPVFNGISPSGYGKAEYEDYLSQNGGKVASFLWYFGTRERLEVVEMKGCKNCAIFAEARSVSGWGVESLNSVLITFEGNGVYVIWIDGAAVNDNAETIEFILQNATIN